MKTCKKCGAINSDDSSYCSSCDAKLEKKADVKPVSEDNEDKIWEKAQTVTVDIKIKAKEERFFEEQEEQAQIKICDICGAYVSSDKNICPDCGNFLTDDADKKANEEINKQLDKLAKASDPFYPNMWEKIVGYFSLVGAVVMAVMVFVSIYFEKFNPYYIVSIILFADVYLNAIKIEWMWYLKQLGMAFTVEHPEDTMPSMFWTFGRKAGIIICAIAGVIFSVFALNGLLFQL